MKIIKTKKLKIMKLKILLFINKEIKKKEIENKEIYNKEIEKIPIDSKIIKDYQKENENIDEIKKKIKLSEEEHKTDKNNWTLKDFQARFLNPEKLENIVKLQKKLIRNGFNLLKKGGILIYSTCSFSKLQNEDVIIDFLNEINKEEKNGILCEVFDENLSKEIPFRKGFLEKTARFDPFVSKSGGMFIARILKL